MKLLFLLFLPFLSMAQKTPCDQFLHAKDDDHGFTIDRSPDGPLVLERLAKRNDTVYILSLQIEGGKEPESKLKGIHLKFKDGSTYYSDTSSIRMYPVADKYVYMGILKVDEHLSDLIATKTVARIFLGAKDKAVSKEIAGEIPQYLQCLKAMK